MSNFKVGDTVQSFDHNLIGVTITLPADAYLKVQFEDVNRATLVHVDPLCKIRITGWY